jgi:hypothetical protein
MNFRASIGTFMHDARVPNPSPFSPYFDQNMDYPHPSIKHNLHRKYPSRYDEIIKNNFQTYLMFQSGLMFQISTTKTWEVLLQAIILPQQGVIGE